MPTLNFAHPPNGHSVAQPFTVILAWGLSAAEIEAAYKRYEERRKQYEDDRSKSAAWPPPPPPPLPFIAQLNVEGVLDWYQWHFDGSTTPTNHRYSDLTTSAGSRRLYAELVDTTTNTILATAAVTVTVV